jgi:3,4-dihydroxy-2-butanone 4-phosphate synthase
MTGERLDELDLAPMVSDNTAPHGTAFTVSIDLIGHGVTTGISAHDRARTIQAAVDASSSPDDFARPGTSSRCVPAPAACWSGADRPRRPSISPASRACTPRA